MSPVAKPTTPSAPPQPAPGKGQAPQRGPETESDAGEEDPGAALDVPETREAMAPGAPPPPRKGYGGG